MKQISWQFFLAAPWVEVPLDEIVDELRDYDERLRNILRKHMAILGWWCIAHALVAIPGMFFLRGPWWFFSMMNAIWAIINFVIVIFLFKHVGRQQFRKGPAYSRFLVQGHVEKMMLFNVGLDLAYLCTGLYLHTLGRVPTVSHPDLWTGFGWSVIVQGVFLLIHDGLGYRLHHRSFRKALPFLTETLRR